MKNKLPQRMRALLHGSRMKVGLVMAAGGLTFAAAVYAASVDNLGLFELDVLSSNATDDPNVAGDDANQIYCDKADPMPRTPGGECDGVAPASASLQTSVFVVDKVGDGDDVFTMGGSKDTNDVTSWRWQIDKATPEKNDISNAFASIYVSPSNETILYLGLDRSANNGDAAIGFWILQNDTKLVPASGTFSAPHKIGDVLIQSDITNGGTVSKFDVYTWQAGGLTLAFDSTQCGSPTADDRACGLANIAEVDAPWDYTPKFGTDGKFPAVSYFEGGVNLTALFPQGIPCLSTFLAETRTSQSEDAVLKDLALGQFAVCSFSITKTAKEVAKAGDPVTYTITVTNTGALPITKTSIVDSKKGSLTADPGCGATLAPKASCVIEYTLTVPADPSADFENTVTAIYSAGSQQLPPKTATHTVNLFKPAVTLDKKANGSNGPLTINQGVQLVYTIDVVNTSTGDTPQLECTVTDQLLGISQNVVLDSGASTTITQNVGAQLTPGETTNTASVTCNPLGYPNTVSANDKVTVTVKKVDPEIAISKTGDPFSKLGDAVNYTITITNPTADQDLVITAISDPLLGGSLINNPNVTSDCPVAPNKLLAGASCVITGSRTTLSTDPNPLTNTASVTVTNEFGNSVSKSASAKVDLVAPNYTVTKDCISGEIFPGDSANFTIHVENTGNVALMVDVVDNLLGINLTGVALGVKANCVFDADASDGCLEVSGSVIAQVPGPINNTVNATATLPPQYKLGNIINRSDDATCPVSQQSGGATRTLGFWKSHGSDGDLFESPVEFGYTCHVATAHVKFPITISQTALGVERKVLMNCADVFGVFWSSPSKTLSGAKRDSLCQTKLHASWQMMAAILNSGLSNGATVPIDPKNGLSAIDSLRLALALNDRANIVRLQGILGAYNESGDNVAIIDSDGATIPHADPNGTRSEANLAAGECNF